jgi:hypothetical protein
MPDDIFETGVEQLDATSAHRADTAWVYRDAHGHEHRWHVDGKPADAYDPRARYDVPTLVWVKDGERIDEDGEPYEVGHLECRECCASVSPGYTADAYTVYVPGLRWFQINGEPVTGEEFARRWAAAHPTDPAS